MSRDDLIAFLKEQGYTVPGEAERQLRKIVAGYVKDGSTQAEAPAKMAGFIVTLRAQGYEDGQIELMISDFLDGDRFTGLPPIVCSDEEIPF